MFMQLGLDQLPAIIAQGFSGVRIGLVAHAASVDSHGTHAATVLAKNSAWQLSALFGPEHGIAGLAADMEQVGQSTDTTTGVPIYSLYGPTVDSLRPTRESLRDIDLLVIDLQDIGTRYYTYIYTAAFCLAAAAEADIPVIVCDRPNPIGGWQIEGPLGDPRFASFVGWYPLPVRHGMTIGELAHYFNDTQNLGAHLRVIPLQDWSRKQYWNDTQLSWINPSPNMRSLAAAILYPGMCLLEATNISEGRGADTPFEICGAPWLDAAAVIEKITLCEIPGIVMTPCTFTPTSRKFAGQLCHGIRWTITDRDQLPSYQLGLALLHAVAQLHPQHFGWRTPTGNPPHTGLDAGPYEFVTDHPAIDLLTGGTAVRTAIDTGAEWRDLAQLIGKPSPDFLAARQQHLLY